MDTVLVPGRGALVSVEEIQRGGSLAGGVAPHRRDSSVNQPPQASCQSSIYHSPPERSN